MLATLLPGDLKLFIRPNHSFTLKKLMDKKIKVVKDILNRLTTYKSEDRVFREIDSEEEEPGG